MRAQATFATLATGLKLHYRVQGNPAGPWLVLHDGDGQPSSTAAIVRDLSEELRLDEPAQLSEGDARRQRGTAFSPSTAGAKASRMRPWKDPMPPPSWPRTPGSSSRSWVSRNPGWWAFPTAAP